MRWSRHLLSVKLILHFLLHCLIIRHNKRNILIMLFSTGIFFPLFFKNRISFSLCLICSLHDHEPFRNICIQIKFLSFKNQDTMTAFTTSFLNFECIKLYHGYHFYEEIVYESGRDLMEKVNRIKRFSR